MAQYEDELKDKAQKFWQEHYELKRADEDLREAQRRRDDRYSKCMAAEKEIARCVGANITRRVFEVADGFVVVVDHKSDSKYGNVSVEKVL